MSKRIFMGAVAAGMLFSLIGDAADKDKALPKDLPPYAALKPYEPPPVAEVKLQNGLTLWLAPVAGFPKVSFTLAVRGGFAADPKERPGIAKLLASSITEGTTTRNARILAEELQACGGDFASTARTDSIMLQTSVLADKIDTALALLADVAVNAAMAENEVQAVKQRAISELDAQEAEPSFLGRRALFRVMFGGHPYSVISPTKHSIEETTAADLKHEYARRFRPDQAVLVVVGDFDSKRLEALVRKDFEHWKKPLFESGVSVPPPTVSVTKAVAYVPRAKSVQTEFYIGATAPKMDEKDYPAASVANAIFGGMFGSRLVLNIREDKGYTYSPFSFLSPYQKAGLLITGAAVRNDVTGASFNEIAYELNRMGTTSPTEEELQRGKRYLIGSLAVDLQSQDALARTLSRYWVDSLSPADLAHEGEKIQQVSSNEVREAGRKYFPMWRMTTVAVGEEQVIKDELAPFGLEFKKVQ